jgi:hypothetical protein
MRKKNEHGLDEWVRERRMLHFRISSRLQILGEQHFHRSIKTVSSVNSARKSTERIVGRLKSWQSALAAGIVKG